MYATSRDCTDTEELYDAVYCLKIVTFVSELRVDTDRCG